MFDAKNIFDKYVALDTEVTVLINYIAKTMEEISGDNSSAIIMVQMLTHIYTEIEKIRTDQEWIIDQIKDIQNETKPISTH